MARVKRQDGSSLVGSVNQLPAGGSVQLLVGVCPPLKGEKEKEEKESDRGGEREPQTASIDFETSSGLVSVTLMAIGELF